MNETTLSRKELNLVVQIIKEKHLALGSKGEVGCEEHRLLRSLEDKLGSISGNRFKLKDAD